MRATAFVSRPTEAWTTKAQALSNTTLFLVARVGPTVFTVKDEQDGTFKVTLGNPHICTCNSPEDTCIHKLFCLIKVLRVPLDHTLCYQTSLTDTELDQVLDGIARQTSRRQVRPRQVRAIAVVSEEVAKETTVPRQPLIDGEDNTCTICMDDMTADQALTWCRVGCGQNIHAKCMMKCAQHNITNRLHITCPLCRNPMDLDTLKADCKGKSSLKQTFAPVQCSNCKCHQRGTFYRCVECSQAAALQATGKPADFCAECFERQRDPTHNAHHYVRSDVVSEQSHGLEWIPCKNPATRGVITNPELIRELQTRELGVNDYELLLQLSDGGPALDLPSLCVESLPPYAKGKGAKKSGGKSLCWCAAANSPSRIQSNIIISSSVTGAAVLTHLGGAGSSSPTRSDGTGSGESSPVHDMRNMRLLPCRHIAHDRCIRSDVAAILEEDTGKLPQYRCAHPECGAKIFAGLSRKRRSKKTSEAGAADAGKGAPVQSSNDGMSGIVGASCFGSSVPASGGGGAGAATLSALRVNRTMHRRGRNSFGSGSDISVGSAGSGSVPDLGIMGTTSMPARGMGNAGGHAMERADAPSNRSVHLNALPVPLLTMRSDPTLPHEPDLAMHLSSHLGGAHFGGSFGSSSNAAPAPRRPPPGRRVRLRALSDAAHSSSFVPDSSVANGLTPPSLRRASIGAIENSYRHSSSGSGELGSLSDRAPSPAPLPTISAHQRAMSMDSRNFPYSSDGAQGIRGHAPDVLVFNLSKESRQRHRERSKPTVHAADPNLMVASISLSNPTATSGAMTMLGATTAGYALMPDGSAGASGLAIGGNLGAGRKPAGRIVRGLLSSVNRTAAAGETGPLPTLG